MSTEIYRLQCGFKRTNVVADVHMRPQVAARHRALAAAYGHKTLDAYFSAMIGKERLEDALDFIANPYFGAFTQVEFAQELLSVAIGDVFKMPWEHDPQDVPVSEFVELFDGIIHATDLADARKADLRAAARAALDGEGAALFTLTRPLVEEEAAKIAAELTPGVDAASLPEGVAP